MHFIAGSKNISRPDVVWFLLILILIFKVDIRIPLQSCRADSKILDCVV